MAVVTKNPLKFCISNVDNFLSTFDFSEFRPHLKHD